MKFTEQQLSEALKAKLTANNKDLVISQKTLDDHVKVLYAAIVNEDSELDATVTTLLPTFESLQGNYRKDRSDFTKKWEEDHKTNPEPTPEPKPEPKTPDEKLEALLAEIKGMKEERERERTAQSIAEKKASLKAKAKEKGIDDAEWLDGQLALMNVTKDTDVDAVADNVLKLYNKANAHINPDLTPGGSGGGKNNEDTKSFFDSVANSMNRGKQTK